MRRFSGWILVVGMTCAGCAGPERPSDEVREVARDPAMAEVWEQKGDEARAEGKPEEAVRAYARATEAGPTSALYEKLGVLYAEAGVADSARMAYARAIGLDSTNANAAFLFGQFLEKLGAYDEALVHSRRALVLRPENPNFRFAVGAQLFRGGRAGDAVPFLRQAAEAMPLHYPARYNLGQALLRIGREDEARAQLAQADTARVLMTDVAATEEAAARYPDEARHVLRLGRLYHRAGLYDRAIEAFDEAARRAPGNLDAASGLARAAMALGRMNEAIQRFETVLAADPGRLDDWLALGLARAVAGQCPEARSAWEAALRLEPDNETARGYLAGLCTYTAPG